MDNNWWACRKITVFAICMRVDHVAAGSCRVSVSKTTYVEMKRLGIFFCAFQEPTKQPLVRARTLSVVSTATLRHWMSMWVTSGKDVFVFAQHLLLVGCFEFPKLGLSVAELGLARLTCFQDFQANTQPRRHSGKTLQSSRQTLVLLESIWRYLEHNQGQLGISVLLLKMAWVGRGQNAGYNML